jgi:hypothetical protein
MSECWVDIYRFSPLVLTDDRLLQVLEPRRVRFVLAIGGTPHMLEIRLCPPNTTTGRTQQKNLGHPEKSFVN